MPEKTDVLQFLPGPHSAGDYMQSVSCKYGAPMGRGDEGPFDGDAEVFTLTRIALDEGGYDIGGAYWGIGKGQGLWIIRAFNRDDSGTWEECGASFRRGPRHDAPAQDLREFAWAHADRGDAPPVYLLLQ